MSEDILNKKAIRQIALNHRSNLGEKERAQKSLQIQQKVLSLSEFKEANTVMLFLNFRDEVETTFLAQETLALGKNLILPRCAPNGIIIPLMVKDLSSDIEPGMWGIREPKKEGLVQADPARIDFILVPGAAFDLKGNRLGYGAGYYDRFFSLLHPSVPKTAIAFECQILEDIPIEEHDVKMSILVTENNTYQF